MGRDGDFECCAAFVLENFYTFALHLPGVALTEADRNR